MSPFIAVTEKYRQRGAIDFSTWFSRVIGWDGILPLGVASLSAGLAAIIPNNQAVAETVMVVIPIAAFFVRFSVGSRQIRDNACGPIARRVQLAALGLAILIFLLADFLIVLSAFIPKNNRNPPPEDIPIYFIGIGLYVLLVTVAMYPGRSVAESTGTQETTPIAFPEKAKRKAKRGHPSNKGG